MPGCGQAQSFSTLQSGVQPSADLVFPSSHSSPSPGSILPLPQPTAHAAASAQIWPASDFEPPSCGVITMPEPPLPPTPTELPPVAPPGPLLGPTAADESSPPAPCAALFRPLSVPHASCANAQHDAPSVAKISFRCMERFLLRGTAHGPRSGIVSELRAARKGPICKMRALSRRRFL
jgi:hypothetical protein